MFIQVVDASSVPIIINTDAISHIQVNIKESKEDPTQSRFKSAILYFNNSLLKPIFFDEANYDIIKQALILQ